ncbi:4Fe-4S binding protein [Prolixibacter bellariivorans]|uniref:4Fe-4S binding protein n=1 Tax=Prolixibacter bellariivorans TaxID=314319 RepID=UPI0009E01289
MKSSILVNEHYCPKNHPCPVVRVCPTGAISQKTPFHAPEIDQEKCVSCGKCMYFCAFGAFQPGN